MRSLKIFIACFCGAVIGALMALYAVPHSWLLAVVGVVLGGFVGYLGCEPKAVLRTMRIAWGECWHWHPTKLQLKMIFIMPALFFSVCCSCLVFLLSPLVVKDIRTIDVQNLVIFMVCFCFAGLAIGILVWDSAKHYPEENIKAKYWELRKWTWQWSPIMVYGYWLPKLIWALCKTGIPIFCHFVKTVFILIHSDVCLLCGIDAMAGAIVGFFLLNPWIGGLAGGVFGVISYLVASKLILRSQPQQLKAR